MINQVFENLDSDIIFDNIGQIPKTFLNWVKFQFPSRNKWKYTGLDIATWIIDKYDTGPYILL